MQCEDFSLLIYSKSFSFLFVIKKSNALELNKCNLNHSLRIFQ